MIPQVMDNNMLSRPYLESLTSAQLFELAEQYGIDIPPDLNRRFIIGELLEELESERNELSDDIQTTEISISEPTALPPSYNETQISVIIRNPAWVYVFWDIREIDLKTVVEAAEKGNLYIRVLRFLDEESPDPNEIFDISISAEDRDQYVFIKPGSNVLRFDLVVSNETDTKLYQTFAVSRRVILPKILPDIDSSARVRTVSPILELSGLPQILKCQYEEYRQSFS